METMGLPRSGSPALVATAAAAAAAAAAEIAFMAGCKKL